MKRIPISRVTKATATSGAVVDFTEKMLRDAAKNYDAALHEAPIVVGHPKDNHPAFGWIKSLEFNEATGELEAIPHEVDADFADAVENRKAYKKRSASWYLPDAPNNPKPGTLYLRHVGFLGAMPPSIKGLRDVSFAEGETGVVEFADELRWGLSSLAIALRGIRDWFISEKGIEVANQVLSDWTIRDVEAAARSQDKPIEAAALVPNFSEDETMNIAELQAQIATLTAENATLKANQRPADFAERESKFATREAALLVKEAKFARIDVEARVDQTIKDGRVLAAQKKNIVDFAMSLTDGELTVDFTEGDKTEKVSQRDAYLRGIEKGPKVVEFGEISGAKPGEKQPTASDEADFAEAQKTLFTQVMG